MRLLNTTTLQLEEVSDSSLDLEENNNAILSHRWGPDEDEVTFRDMLSSIPPSHKRGYEKIKMFCAVASSENCRYGWVDTCCINKESSSELAEAITSMYLWYESSKICLAYLEDVPRKEMMESEWFDRGWTLQELIAPKRVAFFDQHWTCLGTKSELLTELSHKTNIPTDILSHGRKPIDCSVAQRMSWAAKRITKRIEDRAYSLMGLFKVDLPMSYGERTDAFLRFQQEIVRKTKDESLFAWQFGDHNVRTYSGLYAPSPSSFVDCSEIKPTPGSKNYSESNGELSLWTRYFGHTPGTYLALLNCSDHRYGPNNRVAPVLGKVSSSENTFVRVRDHQYVSNTIVQYPYEEDLEVQQIHVPIDPRAPPFSIFFGFWLRKIQPPGSADSQKTVLSNVPTREEDFICQESYVQGNTGIVRIKTKSDSHISNRSEIRWIKFGFTKGYPCIWLANDSHSKRLENSFERALASQQSGGRSEEFKKAMKEDLLQGCKGEALADLRDNWPEGRAVVVVKSETGLRELFIDKLGLQISVDLQPYRTPTMALSATENQSGLPMKVWVIEMTSTDRRVDTEPPKYLPPQLSKFDVSGKDIGECLGFSFLFLFTLPIFVIPCCWSAVEGCRDSNPDEWDKVYALTIMDKMDTHNQNKRKIVEEARAVYEAEKREYEANQKVPDDPKDSTGLPILIVDE